MKTDTGAIAAREDGNMSEKQFKLGDRVKWASQSQGYVKHKSGIIVQVVQPGDAPDRDKFLSLYNGAGIGGRRGHVSYVVELDRIGRRKPKYYWPRVSALEVA